MWLFNLVSPKQEKLTHEQIILRAMQSNLWKIWDTRDFQKAPHFVGYKANIAIGKLRRKGLIENGPRLGKYQTYTITDKGLKEIV